MRNKSSAIIVTLILVFGLCAFAQNDPLNGRKTELDDTHPRPDTTLLKGPIKKQGKTKKSKTSKPGAETAPVTPPASPQDLPKDTD